MNIFFNVLQGAYAYLLIFQILIVTGLFLTLIWLVVRRTRELVSEPSIEVPMTNAPIVAAFTAPPAAISESAPTPVTTPATENLQKQIVTLEADLQLARKAEEESKSLGEKVRYLESKLLEYEILQEEISTLSTLKMENEELKKKLVQSGMTTTVAPPVATELETPAAAPTSEALPSEPQQGFEKKSHETILEPESVHSSSTSADFKDEIKPEPTASVETSPSSDEESTKAKEPEVADLEALLKQIDEIAGAQQEPAAPEPTERKSKRL